MKTKTNTLSKLSKDKLIKKILEYKQEMADYKKKVRDSKELIDKFDQVKSEFIAVTSHQLRTPISSIKWCLEILLSEDFGELNQKQKNFVKQANESNERILNILEDLLNAAEIEKGKVKLSKEKVEFEPLIENITNKFKDKIKLKKIICKITNTFEKGEEIFLDKEKIKKALSNIIENAIKYNYVGGRIDIDISKTKKQGDNYLKCSISDSGAGIPKDEINLIFSKFFRADNVITIDTDGNGLGLYVAKSYVESHGGKIWVESKVGKGAIFIILLPLN